MRIPIPERQVTDVDRIDVAVQGDHYRPVTDPSDDVAHRIDAYFVVTKLQHLILDAFHHCAFF